MDPKTLARYNKDAADFITRYERARPVRLYKLTETFFHKNALTLDLGCASGRDLSYFQNWGFRVEGLDAAESFVEHCRRKFPAIPIHLDSLPKLSSITDGKYENIFLSAVLMHLPLSDLGESIVNILRIAKTGARIIVSIRQKRPDHASAQQANRETDGRLFTEIPEGKLLSLFEGSDTTTLLHESQAEEGREGVIWHNFVFEKAEVTA